MSRLDIPHLSDIAVEEDKRFTRAWASFFEGIWRRIGGGKAYSLGGRLTTDTSPVGNVGAGEDNLITYSLDSNTLKNAGDVLEVVAYGTTAANANNKTIKLILGSTTLFSTGALAFNNDDWCIRSTITRTGAATQKVITTFHGDYSLITSTADYVSGTADFTTTLTLKCTGTATSNNDIVQQGLMVNIYPVAG